ncbi:AAA family ATPase [Myxococcota bacterium]|nr:AAA family ATPase [Myxococcota bacterium]
MTLRSRPTLDAAADAGTGTLITVMSGKGGVGKTNIATNLAIAAARSGRRILLIDGALGLANVDVLLGLLPSATLLDVLDGSAPIETALLEGPRGITVLPAAAGRSELATLDRKAAEHLAHFVTALSRRFDATFLDAASGIGPAVVALAGASRRRVLVTNGEPTSLADAYSLLKVLGREHRGQDVDLLVNAARHAREARATRDRIGRLATRFLDLELGWLGWLPHDPRLVEAVARQRALVDLFPACETSSRLVGFVDRLLPTKPCPMPAGWTRRDPG